MVAVPTSCQLIQAAARGGRCAMFAAMALSGHAALASDADTGNATMVVALAGTPAVPGTERGGPQLEISTTSLPRFDNVDTGNRTSRIDMTTWSAPQRSALGLSLGMTGADTSAPAFASPNRASLSPSLDLGVKWRYTVDGTVRLDVTAYRRIVPPDALTMVETRDAAQYGARVEMALGSSLPRSGFVADKGFLGVQLESGARVTLKRSGGKPMMYYRSKF
ncbi:hypothetical protein [Caenimonas aquaedulcis]|uniref:Uncharacterized protein n=1 Tax=Caenimonas aquaedulcis TaxID=2793270 RepID=A0A931H297_9BURK|nr:hypothetical protein [Caenimonas aquaedulcis]MBG9387179.1 hypothetical protein [Caenimonas aquaedulcis]